MALQSDFQDILTVFIYTNLPLLMNPIAAANEFALAVAANTVTLTESGAGESDAAAIELLLTAVSALTAATVASPLAATVSVSSTNLSFIFPPQLLPALEAAALNDFQDLGLPADITEIAQVFFANLPPVSRLTAAAARIAAATTSRPV